MFALGLAGAGDGVIWARAAAEGFVLVTKDEDFLRFRAEHVRAFADHPEAAFLALG